MQWFELELRKLPVLQVAFELGDFPIIFIVTKIVDECKRTTWFYHPESLEQHRSLIRNGPDFVEGQVADCAIECVCGEPELSRVTFFKVDPSFHPGG